MADRKSLGVIGYVLGGVTAIVMMIGVTAVNSNAGSWQAAPGIYGTASR